MTKSIHILLVEDNPGDADLTRDTLETGKLAVDIAVATDGAEALEYLLQQGRHLTAIRPDLVIMDLNLPKLDGREVLAEMKRHAGLCTIPVVILTSSEAEKDVLSSYQIGANCYISKPVGLLAFQSIIHSIEGFWFTVVKLP